MSDQRSTDVEHDIYSNEFALRKDPARDITAQEAIEQDENDEAENATVEEGDRCGVSLVADDLRHKDPVAVDRDKQKADEYSP